MMGMQKSYALILGIVLTLVGIWGFFTDSILGLFSVNTLHSTVHLLVGLVGIYAGTKTDGKMYNMVFGWAYGALGVLGFIPFVSDIIMGLLSTNTADNVLHLAIGIVSLGVYYGAGE